jgi:hypothetical protein
MTDMNNPSPLHPVSALRDGRPGLTRAACADDRERLVPALQGSLSVTESKRLEEADVGRCVLRVTTLGSGNEETS